MTRCHRLLDRSAVHRPTHRVALSFTIFENSWIMISRQPSTHTIRMLDNLLAQMFFRLTFSLICAALLQWGMNETVDRIWHSAESQYYDNVNSNGGCLTPRKGKEKAHSVGVEGAGSPRNHDSNGGDDLNGGSLTLPEGARTAPTPRLKTMDDAMDFLLLLWSHQNSGHREDPSISTQEKEHSRDKVTSWLQSV